MGKTEEKRIELATTILAKVGGEENVSQVSHCYTRLRFTINNPEKIKDEELKAVEGVLGLVVRGNEYQVVIGPDVGTLYLELVKLGDFKEGGNVQAPATKQKVNLLTRLLDFIGGTFSPIIPVLVAGGLTGAVLTILTNFFGVSNTSGTYTVFYAINQTAFYFLPIFIGFSAAKKLNINAFMGAMLGAFLLYPTINGAVAINFFGLNVHTVAYNTTVFPVILGVLFMAPIYKLFDRVLPKQIKTIFLPLLTMIIVAPITLLFLGPIGGIGGEYLAKGVFAIYNFSPAIAVMIIGIATPLMVFFGMNNAMYPIVFALFASVNCDPLILAGMLSANVACGAACMAVGVKAKNVTTKSVGFSTGITGLMGITEPAVYGILFPLKTPLVGAMIGGGVGGLLAGIFKIAGYSIASPSFVSLPIFIANDGTMGSLYKAIIVVVVSVAVAFAATFVLYKEKNVLK